MPRIRHHMPVNRAAYPPPGPQIYALDEEARSKDYRVRWARHPGARADYGGRFAITRTDSRMALFASDEVQAIADWLRSNT